MRNTVPPVAALPLFAEYLWCGPDFHLKQQNSGRGMIAVSTVPPAPTFALIDMLNLIESRRQKIAELCRHYQVKRLDVFGSAAREDFHQGTSDIDLLVEFDE
ncbi:MAG: nucleotidyltransferase domain-containing protein, partial [Sulfuritalea sp.]|nr:nucleotidyltransferase domain-containing protein [Sulfuritalea sp.]